MSEQKKRAEDMELTDEEFTFSTGKKSTTIQTILDIWNVLAEHASPDTPLTISQIAEILDKERSAMLKANGESRGPSNAGYTKKERQINNTDNSLTQQAMASKKTVMRYLPDQIDAINTLYPHTVLCEKGKPSILHTYVQQDTLHVVVETKDGTPQWSGNMTAILKPSATNPIPEKTLNRRLPNLMSQFGEANHRPNRKPPLISLSGVMIKNPGSKNVEYVSALDYGLELGHASGKASSQHDGAKKDGRSPTRRFYLQSLLTPAEWRILSDLIRVYPYIDEQQTEKFLSVLQRMAPGVRKWSGKRYAQKMDAGMQFSYIEELDRAIREQRQVSVTYGRYQLGTDNSGKLKPQLQAMPNHKYKGLSYAMKVDPYAMMWSNGYYYLVCKYNGAMRNLRMDRVLQVLVLDDTFEKDPKFDPYEYRDRSPVMHPGEPTFIRLRCPLSMLSTVMDFFATTIMDYSTPKEAADLPPEKRYTEVTLRASESGSRLFALQYADQVEILEPQSLRDEVVKTLKAAAKKYQ